MSSAAVVRPVGSPGRRRVSRERVVAAALALIDTQGLRGFSMRALGVALGVRSMSTYRYVPTREALLDAVVELVIDGLHNEPDDAVETGDWQGFLVRSAHEVRRVALAHPRVFPLIATRPSAASWVRPPLRSLAWMESFLGTLRSCGFTGRGAVAAYRTFSSFLLGHLMLEVAAMGVDVGPEQTSSEPGPAGASGGRLDATYPTLAALRPEMSLDRSAQEFETSLHTVIARIAGFDRKVTDVPPVHPVKGLTEREHQAFEL